MEPVYVRRAEKSRGKNRKKRVVLIIILVVLLLAGAATAAIILLGKKPAAPPSPKVTHKSKEPKGPVNPYTGLIFKKSPSLSRPIIISTDNDSYRSRPQAGISKADIIYEVPIEGGGSRYEPLYYSNIPKLMGAVRSCRPYILDIAREYGAVLIHNGQSPQAIQYFPSSNVDRISAANHYDVFHYENIGRLPGNLFVAGDAVKKKFKSLGYDSKKGRCKLKWLKKGEHIQGKKAAKVSINYADGAYNTYVYDKTKDLYKKLVKDVPLTDMNNNEEVSCQNILVQFVSYNLYDRERLNINLCEGGPAYLFTKGKVIKGTWSRSDKDSNTFWQSDSGDEFKLTPGKTWINIIDRTVKFQY